MKKQTTESTQWAKTGWPWELEIMAIALAAIALFLPCFLADVPIEKIEGLTLIEEQVLKNKQSLGDLAGNQADATWALIIPFIYLVHIVFARSGASRLVSTPLVHLFTPIVFFTIIYLRCAERAMYMPEIQPLFTGSPVQMLFWVILFSLFILIVARVRMARYLVRFKDVDWAVSTPTRNDKSFWNIAMYIQPVIYRPRLYYAFEKGIIVEGWLYVMAIPFEDVQWIERIRRNEYLPSGYYLATSSKSLLKVKLLDFQTPILISPLNLGPFRTYCRNYVAEIRESTHLAGKTVADKAA